MTADERGNIGSIVTEFKHTNITEKIIEAFYKVYNALGHGFLEKIYVTALIIELRKMGFGVQHQTSIQVYYDGHVVGDYICDILVSSCVIVEVKAVKMLAAEHEAQLLNYLKATRIETGLLLNFGPKPEIKRKAYDNARK
jgi:GxxExxY protein